MDELAEALKGWTIELGPAFIIYSCGHHWHGMGDVPPECPTCNPTIEGECIDLGRMKALEAPDHD